jgi:hypothetical protein
MKYVQSQRTRLEKFWCRLGMYLSTLIISGQKSLMSHTVWLSERESSNLLRVDNPWLPLNAYKDILGHVLTDCEPPHPPSILLSYITPRPKLFNYAISTAENISVKHIENKLFEIM